MECKKAGTVRKVAKQINNPKLKKERKRRRIEVKKQKMRLGSARFVVAQASISRTKASIGRGLAVAAVDDGAPRRVSRGLDLTRGGTSKATLRIL
jgi:hypothetical protein